MVVLGPPELAGIVSLPEFEALARPIIDRDAYDYVAGGSWDEMTLQENIAAWRRRTLRPRVLVDVARVAVSTTMLGVPSAMPVAIAPTAAHGALDPEGELATARAAAAAGIPFILSTFSSRSIEELAAGDGTRWLYGQSDPQRTRNLVERAAAAGYGAIVLTVDMPVVGYRERDRRNRYDLPDPERSPLDVPDATGAYPKLAGGLPPSLTWSDLAAIRLSTIPGT